MKVGPLPPLFLKAVKMLLRFVFFIYKSIVTLPAMQETQGSIPGEGRSPGEGNGNPLQYSYLGNPPSRGAWRATVHGMTKNCT